MSPPAFREKIGVKHPNELLFTEPRIYRAIDDITLYAPTDPAIGYMSKEIEVRKGFYSFEGEPINDIEIFIPLKKRLYKQVIDTFEDLILSRGREIPYNWPLSVFWYRMDENKRYWGVYFGGEFLPEGVHIKYLTWDFEYTDNIRGPQFLRDTINSIAKILQNHTLPDQ